MTWSRSFTNNLAGMVLLLFVCAACTAPGTASRTDLPDGWGADGQLAVLPVHNLSGRGVPAREIREAICGALASRGIAVWNDETFDRFMLANRVRYTGGVDESLSRSFRNRGNIRGVLITTIELYEASGAPKIAMTCRLVDVGEKPAIQWIDSVALTGFDNPGILDLGRIRDIRVILDKGVRTLAASLEARLSGEISPTVTVSRGEHPPRMMHRKASIGEITAGESVIVLPFTNDSPRRYAGEIMQLRMVERLFSAGFRVIEPGVVRDELLRRRMIFDRGVSIPQADTLLNATGVRFLMGGTVQEYDDSSGEGGRPLVSFSSHAITAGDARIVWSASFRNHGEEGVYFYDWGKILTASSLASSMAATAVTSFQQQE